MFFKYGTLHSRCKKETKLCCCHEHGEGGQACVSKHKRVCQSRITTSTREKIRTFLDWQLKTQHHKFLSLLRSNLETFVSSGYSCQTKKSDAKTPPRVLRGLNKIHAKNQERRGVVWKAHHLGYTAASMSKFCTLHPRANECRRTPLGELFSKEARRESSRRTRCIGATPARIWSPCR